MADPDIQRLRAQFHNKLRTSRFIPETKARTGRLSSDTAINPDPHVYDANGNVVTNKTWVRIGATHSTPAGRSTVPVWNFAVKNIRADVPVILVEDDNGDLYIDRADAQAADTLGIPSSFFTPDEPPPELYDGAVPVANIFDLMPYRSDTLVLRARAGWLPNGVYWHDDALADTLDPSPYITATSGMRAYVVAGIDLGTNAWVADTTADRGILLAPGSYDDIEPVLAGWANVFPICAIPLANGATDFAQADIIDLRTWGSGGNGSAADALVADTVGTTAYDLDWNAATLYELTLSGNPTFTFSNLSAGRSLTVVLIQDASGGRTVTWPASVDWPNGTPTLQTSAAAVDVLTFLVLDDGVTVLGFSATDPASGGSLDTVSDGTTTVADATALQFDGDDFTVSEPSAGTATVGLKPKRYRQFLYALDGAGDFIFLTDSDGHPLMALMDLE